jgi:hypothetical protein
MANTAATQGTEDDVFTFPSSQQEFPLAPEGHHKVIVARALFSMRENTFAPEKGKQPTVSLMLQSDQKYRDETTKEDRHYNLFKTFKISDHVKSGMFDFFHSVLGIDVPLNEKKQIVLERKIEKKDDREIVHMPQFENLEFSVIVKHKPNDEGKMRDSVDSIFSSPEQKASNALLFQAPQA